MHRNLPQAESISMPQALITEYGGDDVDIEYELQGTRCDKDLLTQRLRFGLELEFTSSVNRDDATIVLSGTKLEFELTGEIIEMKSEGSKESSIDDTAKRFLHSTFRAAWSTFDSSGRLNDSIFFDNAFPAGLMSGTSSLAHNESDFIVALENWLAVQRQQKVIIRKLYIYNICRILKPASSQKSTDEGPEETSHTRE